MLDIVCVLGVIALFALVALIGRAVERLGSATGGAARSPASRGQERR